MARMSAALWDLPLALLTGEETVLPWELLLGGLKARELAEQLDRKRDKRLDGVRGSV